MKKILATLVATFAFVGVAAAQTAPASTPASSPTRYYVGVNLGAGLETNGNYNDLLNNSTPSVGAVGGRQITNNIAVEATYDYFLERNGQASGQTAFVNGVFGYPISGTRFTPYVLGGVGYGWDSFGDRTLYNVGGGVRADVTKSLAFDVRYRYINNWAHEAEVNVVTAGVNFRF